MLEDTHHQTPNIQQHYVQQRSFQRLGSETRTTFDDCVDAYRGNADWRRLHRKHQFHGKRNRRDAGIFSVGKLCDYHWDGSEYARGFKIKITIQSSG